MQDCAAPTATAIAPTKSEKNYERRYGPQAKIDLDDLKCVDCAYCGRELVGQSHRKHAHQFGMMVAHMVHDRPYCPTCVPTATSRMFTCATCGGKAPCLKVEFQNGIPYCLGCAALAEPVWRNVLAIDRNKSSSIVKHDNPQGTTIEKLADAAAAVA